VIRYTSNRFEGYNGTEWMVLSGGSGGGGSLWTQSGFDIYYNNTGNVGVGTATPASFKLQVAGHLGPNADGLYDLGSTAAEWRNLFIDGSAYIDNVYFDSSIYHYGDSNTMLYFNPDRLRAYIGGEYLLDIREYGNDDYVKLGDGGDVDINLNDMMFVNGSNGNVGIGTTEPQARLHVMSGTGPYYHTTLTGNQLQFNRTNNAASYIDKLDTGQIMFRMGPSVTIRMTIESDGDVGIGDSTPDGSLKLDVEGPVGATQYCDQAGGNCKAITEMGGGQSDQAVGTTNIQTSSGSLVDMSGMQVTLNSVAAGSNVLINFAAPVRHNIGHRGCVAALLVDDGSGSYSLVSRTITYTYPGYSNPLAITWLEESVTGGTVRAKIQWRTVSDGTWYQDGATYRRVLTVAEL
jgi:hypothetical protein